MIFGAFDIGLYNTAFYVEEFDEKKLLEIKNIPKTKRYNNNKEPTNEFNEILRQVYLNGKCIEMFKVSFGEKKKKFIGTKTLNTINDFIKSNEKMFKTCKVIIIEKQMHQNNIAVRIQSHLESILGLLYPEIQLMLFPSKNKTIINGAPDKLTNKKGITKKITYAQRKKWSFTLTKKILEDRKDEKGLDLLSRENKQDDMSDCLTELQAAKYLFFIEKKFKIL